MSDTSDTSNIRPESIVSPEISNTSDTAQRLQEAQQKLREAEQQIEEARKRHAEIIRVMEETPSTSALASKDHNNGTSITMTMDTVSHILTKLRNEDRSLPTFRGSVLDWPLFIQKYQDTTREFNITDDKNHKRLDNAIRGEARDTVREMLRYPCFVKDVIEVLEATFGGRDNVASAAMELLNKMKSLRPDLSNLVTFTLEVTKVHRMLKQCKLKSVQRQAMRRFEGLMPLTQLQSWDLQRQSWELQQQAVGDSTATLDGFVDWLSRLKRICKVYSRVERRDQTLDRTENPNHSPILSVPEAQTSRKSTGD